MDKANEDAAKSYAASAMQFKNCRDDLIAKLSLLVKETYGQHAIVDGRIKTLASTLGKMVGKKKTWSEVRDKVALKVIVPTEACAKDFVESISSVFPDWQVEIDQKVLKPKEMGYTSIHLDCSCPSYTEVDGSPLYFEIQVRTMFQDAWYVNDHGLRYKGDTVVIPDKLTRGVLRLSALTEMIDEEVTRLLNAKADLTTSEPLRAFEVMVTLFDRILDIKDSDYALSNQFIQWYSALYDEQEKVNFERILKEFLEVKGSNFQSVMAAHSASSENYLAAQDWIFESPYVLMIAERCAKNPVKVNRFFKNSDWRSAYQPVLQEFSQPI